MKLITAMTYYILSVRRKITHGFLLESLSHIWMVRTITEPNTFHMRKIISRKNRNFSFLIDIANVCHNKVNISWLLLLLWFLLALCGFAANFSMIKSISARVLMSWAVKEEINWWRLKIAWERRWRREERKHERHDVISKHHGRWLGTEIIWVYVLIVNWYIKIQPQNTLWTGRNSSETAEVIAMNKVKLLRMLKRERKKKKRKRLPAIIVVLLFELNPDFERMQKSAENDHTTQHNTHFVLTHSKHRTQDTWHILRIETGCVVVDGETFIEWNNVYICVE